MVTNKSRCTEFYLTNEGPYNVRVPQMFTKLKKSCGQKSLGNAGIETLAYLDHIVCHFLSATRPHSTWPHERAAQMTSSAPVGWSAVLDQSILQSQWETIPTSYARHTILQKVLSQIQTKDTRRAFSKTIFILNCRNEIKRVNSDSQQTGILASDALSVTMQDDPWNDQRCGSDKLWTPQLMLPVGANSHRRCCVIRPPSLPTNNFDSEVIFSNPTNELYDVHQCDSIVSISVISTD